MSEPTITITIPLSVAKKIVNFIPTADIMNVDAMQAVVEFYGAVKEAEEASTDLSDADEVLLMAGGR